MLLTFEKGIKHRKNEVFLDVVESVNLLVSAKGHVLHSDIVGSVQMRVFLTGTSENVDARTYRSTYYVFTSCRFIWNSLRNMTYSEISLLFGDS